MGRCNGKYHELRVTSVYANLIDTLYMSVDGFLLEHCQDSLLVRSSFQYMNETGIYKLVIKLKPHFTDILQQVEYFVTTYEVVQIEKTIQDGLIHVDYADKLIYSNIQVNFF